MCCTAGAKGSPTIGISPSCGCTLLKQPAPAHQEAHAPVAAEPRTAHRGPCPHPLCKRMLRLIPDLWDSLPVQVIESIAELCGKVETERLRMETMVSRTRAHALTRPHARAHIHTHTHSHTRFQKAWTCKLARIMGFHALVCAHAWAGKPGWRCAGRCCPPGPSCRGWVCRVQAATKTDRQAARSALSPLVLLKPKHLSIGQKGSLACSHPSGMACIL